jgi:hypothetical protein
MVPFRHTIEGMRRLAWKPEKNEWLKRERGFSFEQIEEAIAVGGFKGIAINRAHPEQIIIAVLLDGYVIGVPATIQSAAIMLWTAYYSRKLNKRYGGKKL